MDCKTCRDCGVEKPASDFYARRPPRKLSSYCKPCFAARNDRNEIARKERRRVDAEAGKRTPPVERFWSQVEKTDGCWFWRGPVNMDRASRGGRFNVNDKDISTRRYSWELVHGPLASDQYLWLTCAEPLCVRPDHLETRPKMSTIDGDMKRCSRCRMWKPLDQYSPSQGSSAHGMFNYCKACAAEYMKTKNFRSKDADYRLQKKYGLTESEYLALHEQHAGRCGICGDDGGKQGLGIDHDHDTGTVRGLLCGPCNAGIAMLKHDAGRILSAAVYVEKWGAIISASASGPSKSSTEDDQGARMKILPEETLSSLGA